MKRFLTTVELREMLVAAGQRLTDREECPAFVWPASNVVVVGAGVDQFTAIPRHHFVCLPWETDDPPQVHQDPAFALTRLFAAAEEQSPSDSDFLRGPVRWLVQRMYGWTSAWLWCDRRRNCYFDQFRGGGEFPKLREWLARHLPTATEVAAIHLDLTAPLDVAVLWEKAGHVGRDLENYFLGDPAGNEVYLLHHHDEVFASVPDKAAWVRMVGELSARPDLFEDLGEAAGYGSDEGEADTSE